MDLEDEYAIAQSLQAYNSWLSRFFVAVLKTKNPEIVEIEYFEGTDRLKRIIPRSYYNTKMTYLKNEIKCTAEGRPVRLFEWYFELNTERRTADQVKMWVTEADRKAHPRDLNIFGGLPYDARYDKENKKEIKQFEDPFPKQMKVEMGSSQRTLAAGEPDWRAESGLRFILWHTRNILCGGESPEASQ